MDRCLRLSVWFAGAGLRGSQEMGLSGLKSHHPGKTGQGVHIELEAEKDSLKTTPKHIKKKLDKCYSIKTKHLGMPCTAR